MNTREGVEADRRYALIGWPLHHSLSPVMHNAAFRHCGISARYTLMPTTGADLTAAVDDVRDGRLAGANITTPHKVAARSMVDHESPLVAATGSVNTLVRAGRTVRGENTDVAGFRYALQTTALPPASVGSALVLGAGGASRAVVYALLEDGWQVTVLNRSAGPLGVLAGIMHRAFDQPRLRTAPLDGARCAAHARDTDLLVNATSVGSHPEVHGSPWPDGRRLPRDITVVDLVAWPAETTFVRDAKNAGADAHGGLEMLVGQAAAAWSLWTGQPAPIDEMRRAAGDALGSNL